jgi:hypothetical protein
MIKSTVHKGDKDMTANDKPVKRIRFSVMGICMGLGLVMGGLLGMLIDNLAVFAGGGMVLGLALGTALENRRVNH